MKVVCKENSMTSMGHRKEILVVLKDVCGVHFELDVYLDTVYHRTWYVFMLFSFWPEILVRVSSSLVKLMRLTQQ